MLMGVCVTRMGCGGLDYRQQAQQMELKTGGMSISTSVTPDYSNMDMYEQVSPQPVSKPVSQSVTIKPSLFPTQVRNAIGY